ncbi:MAG: hypothetical protein IPK93_12405 [Solirubrobacterales bacterium]|nr:hypothetical protein [Solirubrobacterales bacterium]
MIWFTFKKMLLITMVAMAVVFAGCGGTEQSTVTKADRQLQTKPVDLLMPDCSGSFKGKLDEFIGTIKTVVSDSATRGRTLWHGCFDGSPLRTLIWSPKVDFGNLPDSVRANDQVASRFTEARAMGTVKKIEQAIAITENRVAGSGQLEALEVAAKTPNVGRAILVTDLITFEADGIRLAAASHADIKQTVKRWLPRLGDGLQGVQVFIVGYGLDAGSSKAARSGVELFTRLVTKAEGQVSITKDLPADLVVGGGGR